MQPKTDHGWPTDQAAHKWSDWQAFRAREGTKPPQQYRTCIDPGCGAAEHREAPKG